MDDREKHIRRQIEMGGYNIPDHILLPALLWIKSYAETHEEWNGGDLLPEYKESKTYVDIKPHKPNWTGPWGSIVSIARTEGLMTKVGDAKPTSFNSHTKELAEWASNVYKPDFLR